MAPYLAEELWSLLGKEDTLAHESWPEANQSLLEDDEITLVVPGRLVNIVGQATVLRSNHHP